MGRLILTAIIILLLTNIVYAWGPITHKYICREVSNRVWGSNITNICLVQNFNYMARLCDTIMDIEGEDIYTKCIENLNKNVLIDPSIMPDVFFNETDNTVKMKADAWFEVAIYTLDTCSSIHEFCVGSHYFADSLYPIRGFDYPAECRESLDSDVDKKIASGIKNWEIRAYCSQQEFVVNNGLIDNIISNLTENGNFIKESQRNVTTEIEASANETFTEFQQEFHRLIGKGNITNVKEQKFKILLSIFNIFLIILIAVAGIFTIIYVTIKTKQFKKKL